jgi:hypothetical protein
VPSYFSTWPKRSLGTFRFATGAIDRAELAVQTTAREPEVTSARRAASQWLAFPSAAAAGDAIAVAATIQSQFNEGLRGGVGRKFSLSDFGCSDWACRCFRCCRRRLTGNRVRKTLLKSSPRTLRKTPNHCLTGVYAAEKTENVHEIGCVRGAFCISKERNDRPVYGPVPFGVRKGPKSAAETQSWLNCVRDSGRSHRCGCATLIRRGSWSNEWH